MTIELLDQLQRALGSVYAVERELGGGGMARVYLATERALGRRVVIKVLEPELAGGIKLERFVREMHVAARLQHPHIVPLLAAGDAGGVPYYTMPYVEGESLRNRLTRDGALPVAETVTILRDVAGALSYAHRHGVVHRDIKPDNVLLSDGRAQVADFGLAKAIGASSRAGSLTMTGMVVGTPAYMAPEQITDSPLADHRVDLYAFGALAYEMLAGQAPFDGPTAQAILAAQVTRTPPPLATLRRDVPRALGALIAKCLAKEPGERPASADEVLSMLDSAPLKAAPRAESTRETRWRRVATACVCVVGLGAAGIFGLRRWRADARDPQTPGSRKMLVVLPFKNLGRPEDALFADGVTEEITNHLAAIRGLGVISRTTADQYKSSAKSLKQIAQDLGADYVLEGSVRWEPGRAGPGRVRVTPELIRVADDTHVWADEYDAEMHDVFDIQSRVATQVVHALDVTLHGTEHRDLARRPTDNLQAYEYYVRGRLKRCDLVVRECAEALALYERAVALDSNFALAWAMVAASQLGMFHWGLDASEERVLRGKQAADKALALDPHLPEAHQALGYYYYYHKPWDLQPAFHEFKTAAAGEPNDPAIARALGGVYRRFGDWANAKRELEHCIEVDPKVTSCTVLLAATHEYLHEYALQGAMLDRAIALNPETAELYVWRAHSYLEETGDLARVAGELESGVSRVGTKRIGAALGGELLAPLWKAAPALIPVLDSVTISDLGGDHLSRATYYYFRGDTVRGRAYADSARRDLELFAARMPREFMWRSQLGLAYAWLGQRQDAIREARAGVTIASSDPVDGPLAKRALATVYAIIREPVPAVRELRNQLSPPSLVSPAWLRFNPELDAIRNDAGFQHLVSSSP